MLTRRDFFKLTGASTVAWYTATQFGWVQRAMAQIPGGTLDPGDVTKFVTPLLIPPVMPRAATITMPGGKPADYYEISMKQFPQQILPAGMPDNYRLGIRRDQVGEQEGAADPQRALADDRGAGEPAGARQVDQRPRERERQLPPAPAARGPDAALGQPPRRHRLTATHARRSTETPGPYTGPVPIVTHLHGAVGVGDESDGYAEAWYLPAAGQHPRRLRDPGHLVRLLRQQGSHEERGRRGGPGSPPSSTPTGTEPRPSGTTTTRWA